MLVQSEVGSLQELATFQQEELDMLMPLVETGDVARSEIIRMQRTTVETEGRISNIRAQYIRDLQTDLRRRKKSLSQLSNCSPSGKTACALHR